MVGVLNVSRSLKSDLAAPGSGEEVENLDDEDEDGDDDAEDLDLNLRVSGTGLELDGVGFSELGLGGNFDLRLTCCSCLAHLLKLPLSTKVIL